MLAEARELVHTVETNLSCGRVGTMGAEMEADIQRSIELLAEASARIREKREAWQGQLA